MTIKEPTLPTPEQLPTPEELMRNVVARIDRGLSELHFPPRDKRGWGDCNFVPDAVSYCVTQDAAEVGYDARTAVIQTQDLHMLAAGKNAGTVREDYDFGDDGELRDPRNPYKDAVQNEIEHTTYGHGANIVTINGHSFIVDLSFAQFLGVDGELGEGVEEIGQISRKKSGIPNDHPLAQALMANGFVRLTDENLRTYMRLLSTTDHAYLQNVTAALAFQVPERPFAMEKNELLDNIPDAYRLSAKS